VARAAGIVIDWDDFAALSDVVPLLARVYPNGSADVNQFQAAGGPGFVIARAAGCRVFMHPDVLTVRRGLRDFAGGPGTASAWPGRCRASRATSVVRPVTAVQRHRRAAACCKAIWAAA
jgi:phosphogluconate dehydratase